MHYTGSMPRNRGLLLVALPTTLSSAGPNRQTVFHTQRDRRVYLRMLAEQSRLAHVRILAFCLVTNHIHLIAIPDEEDSLWRCLQRVHGRYAQYLNARAAAPGTYGRTGSIPARSTRYTCGRRWDMSSATRASARAHLSGRDEFGVLDVAFWRTAGGVERWRQLIDCQEDEGARRRLRRATFAGDPLGSAEFIEQWKRKPAIQTRCA